MTVTTGINEPRCREALAGEYVLGTLQGPARRRFERLLRQSADLQWYVAEWERLLSRLAEEIEPAPPPRRVWRAIATAIGERRPAGRNGRSFWRPLAMVSAALLVAVTLFIGMGSREVGHGDYVFIIEGDVGQTQWVVTASMETRRLNIRPVAPPNVGPERLCRLWWHPKGEAPRLLAILPEGRESVRVRLPPEAGAQWLRDELSVTIGPVETPVPAPVGEEVYRGRWVPMT